MTIPDIEIRAIAGSSLELAPLIAEADAQGHRFLQKLTEEWVSGANRFDGPGECFLGVYREGRLIGVGGLNRDPYAAGKAGRLRRLYILEAARRTGTGTALVEQLIATARAHFDLVRLRTDCPSAARFYRQLGFSEIAAGDATHQRATGAATR
jgi:GNAT superfamily N-acetyltransferase